MGYPLLWKLLGSVKKSSQRFFVIDIDSLSNKWNFIEFKKSLYPSLS